LLFLLLIPANNAIIGPHSPRFRSLMPTEPLDAIDQRILENLQKNGRLTNLELAERVGLSPSPCLRRLRRLEEEGIIVGYAARIDQRKIGLGLTAFVSLSFEKKTNTQAEQIRKTIAAMPEVIGCYITSGEHDVLLQVVVADLDEYRRFSLDRLIKVPGIKDIHSSFALETVKEYAPLPLNQLGNVQRTNTKN